MVGMTDDKPLAMNVRGAASDSLNPPKLEEPKHGKEDSKNEPHVRLRDAMRHLPPLTHHASRGARAAHSQHAVAWATGRRKHVGGRHWWIQHCRVGRPRWPVQAGQGPPSAPSVGGCQGRGVRRSPGSRSVGHVRCAGVGVCGVGGLREACCCAMRHAALLAMSCAQAMWGCGTDNT